MAKSVIQRVYRNLLKRYGSQDWWPIEGGFRPREWEVMLGAILTQNTSWKNVLKALEGLRQEGLNSPEAIAGADEHDIERAIRPSGYFRQKASRLKSFSKFVLSFGSFGALSSEITRERLLDQKGIGPETADTVLSYALGKPFFVVDMYTKRLFMRIGLEDPGGYEQWRSLFESALPENAFKEFHALIVEHSKAHCRKNPACSGCPLNRMCKKNID